MSACSGAADSREEPSAATESGSTVAAGDAEAPAQLAGSSWRLVEFQSMDDAIGTTRPEDPSRYTMRLESDGTASFRLDCNRANGNWSAQPAGDGSSGSFEFGPLAATTAACPPPSMGERVSADAAYVRGYLLRDGRLYLSLMADAGIYVWEPHIEENRSRP
jgi:heat shock protein HslJ